jgi:hypothetical protein
MKANVVLRFVLVALRTCTVSFVGSAGVRHSVDVTAESLYEAAATGISRLRQDGWVDQIALGTRLEVQVREAPTMHCVSVMEILRWCDGVAVSPDEVLKRRKVKELLGV